MPNVVAFISNGLAYRQC